MRSGSRWCRAGGVALPSWACLRVARRHWRIGDGIGRLDCGPFRSCGRWLGRRLVGSVHPTHNADPPPLSTWVPAGQLTLVVAFPPAAIAVLTPVASCVAPNSAAFTAVSAISAELTELSANLPFVTASSAILPHPGGVVHYHLTLS